MVKTKNDVDIVEETQDCVVENSPSIFCLLESHNLAFLIQEIFLYLDHDSLHQARQVCQDWNEFIMERIWRSRRGKVEMKKKLWRQWKKYEPHKREFEIDRKGFYLAVDEKIIGLGTLDNKAVMLNLTTGEEVRHVECQDTEVLTRMDQNNFISEAESVQLDMTNEVVVTVTGCGVVTVWDRLTMEVLYREAHHGYEPVLGVRAVGDIIITGGINGSMAVLTVSTTEPRVRLECLQRERGQRSINHLDCDTVHILVGTDHDMKLWSLSDRANPVVVNTVPAEHVCCCVLAYPYAACTGLFASYGVQVWDMVKGEQLRHLHMDLSMWVVQVKDNILATSMSGDMNRANTPSIFIHDLTELVDPSIKDKDLWARQIMCPREDVSDPHIAINKTCLFSVTKKGQTGAKVTVWDFWSYNQKKDWDMDTFLNDGTLELL